MLITRIQQLTEVLNLPQNATFDPEKDDWNVKPLQAILFETNGVVNSDSEVESLDEGRDGEHV